MIFAVYFLAWCGVGGLIGYAIGNSKGQGILGFWLGFFLGVIGWIIVAFSQPSDEVRAQRAASTVVLRAQVEQVTAQRTLRACPYCAEMIQPAAIVCRYCGRDIEAADPAIPSIATDVRREERMADLAKRFPACVAQAQEALTGRLYPPADEIAWMEQVCLGLLRGMSVEKASKYAERKYAERSPEAKHAEGEGWY